MNHTLVWVNDTRRQALSLSSMRPLIRIVLLIILALVSGAGTALSQQAFRLTGKTNSGGNTYPASKGIFGSAVHARLPPRD
jgi:hypothetical protein